MTELNTGTNAEKITIRNIAFLDLRTTSEETLRSIGRIENAAAVLYSPQTAASVARISAQNVATMLEAPADAQLVTGQTTWGKRFFEDIEKPLSVIAVGQIMLESDIQPEDVRAGLDKLIVVGQLLYPDHLGGAIQSKIEHLSGQTMAY
jgi:xanthine dehydrogenase iron-sulfur cluster and FAD-binding subunit A